MNTFKKVISFALILCMLFAFAGCGAKEADKFVGTWKGTLDLTKSLNEEMTSDEEGAEMAEYIKFENISFEYVWTFKADGTYTMEITTESVEAAAKNLEATFRAGFEKMIMDQVAEQGVTDITFEEALKMANIDFEDMIAECMEDFAVEDIIADFYGEGNYTAKDGHLCFSDGKDYSVDENIYDVYEFTSDVQFKITDEVDPSDPTDVSSILPLVFDKQA